MKRECPHCGNTDEPLIEDNGVAEGRAGFTLLCVARVEPEESALAGYTPTQEPGEDGKVHCGMQWEPDVEAHNPTPPVTLQCDMGSDCKEPVSHIDNKGFTYCTAHGRDRKSGGYRCRKLRPYELARLKLGRRDHVAHRVGRGGPRSRHRSRAHSARAPQDRKGEVMTMRISREYNVETDAADWPLGLTDEDKAGLKDIVLEILRGGPLETYLLHERVKRMLAAEDFKRVPSFKNAALLDWTYGAVVRACRATDCEQCWHVKYDATSGYRPAKKAGKVESRSREVAREDFLRDPGAVARRASSEGPITILDAAGAPAMVVSYPKPRPDPLDGIPSDR